MSYMKKDEDAEASLLKLDRTSVFQEGVLIPCFSRPVDQSASRLDKDIRIMIPGR